MSNLMPIATLVYQFFFTLLSAQKRKSMIKIHFRISTLLSIFQYLWVTLKLVDGRGTACPRVGLWNPSGRPIATTKVDISTPLNIKKHLPK